MPGTNISGIFSTIKGGIQNVKNYYRVVVMGASEVGKTAIIKQFLYDQFPTDHCATVEEMYRGEYEVGQCTLVLDILDTSGTYEFPAMRRLAINIADGFILVYSINSGESFEEVKRLRDLVLETKQCVVPIVIVGNKCDLCEEIRVVRKTIAETIISMDWENGFVECSAKDNHNIMEIFKELLRQSKISYDLSPAVKRRRTSLPNHQTCPKVKENVLVKRNSCAIS